MTNAGSPFEHGSVPEEFGAETLTIHEEVPATPPQFWLVTRLNKEYLTTGETDREALANVHDELGLTITEFFSEVTTALKTGCTFERARRELVTRKAVELFYVPARCEQKNNFAD